MAFTPFVESDQPTMAAFNEKFQDCIAEALIQGVHIETGSYTGTGTYGSSNPNSLTFGFVPKFLIVGPENWGLNAGNLYGSWDSGFLWFDGVTKFSYNTSSNNTTTTYISVSGCTISWYNDWSGYETTGYGQAGQMNGSNQKYIYIAIG